MKTNRLRPLSVATGFGAAFDDPTRSLVNRDRTGPSALGSEPAAMSCRLCPGLKEDLNHD